MSTPSPNWYGFFYFNLRDHRVFVPKREGIGYTLYFGGFWDWVVLAAIVATPVLLHALRH